MSFTEALQQLTGLHWIAILGGLIVVLVALSNGWKALKTFIDPLNEKRKDDKKTKGNILSNTERIANIEQWQADIKKTYTYDNNKLWKESDERFHSDNQRLKELEADMRLNREFRRILLMSIDGIINNLITGNGTGEMKKLSEQIKQYLIDTVMGKGD